MLIRRSNQPPVELLTIDGHRRDLERYSCTTEEAARFAATFGNTLDRMPQSATEVLKQHWARGGGPTIWLPRNRGSWPGRGWAASKIGGREFLFIAQIVVAIPEEHLRLFVAHECGHALCCAVGEPSHTTSFDRIRHEWLNWQLMDAWGFDQPAAELWGYRYVDGSGEEPVIRALPLDEEEMRQARDRSRARLLERLTDTSIPEQLRPWLQ